MAKGRRREKNKSERRLERDSGSSSDRDSKSENHEQYQIDIIDERSIPTPPSSDSWF